jgi:hypothetical protein
MRSNGIGQGRAKFTPMKVDYRITSSFRARASGLATDETCQRPPPRCKILYAAKYFGAIGTFAAIAVTLALEPIARIAASPRTTGDTLRAFAKLWKALPAVL